MPAEGGSNICDGSCTVPGKAEEERRRSEGRGEMRWRKRMKRLRKAMHFAGGRMITARSVRDTSQLQRRFGRKARSRAFAAAVDGPQNARGGGAGAPRTVVTEGEPRVLKVRPLRPLRRPRGPRGPVRRIRCVPAPVRRPTVRSGKPREALPAPRELGGDVRLATLALLRKKGEKSGGNTRPRTHGTENGVRDGSRALAPSDESSQ